MKKNNHILIIIFLFVFVSQPADTRALSNKLAATDTAGKYTVLAPLPCIESAGIECKGGNGAVQKEVDFKTYVQYTINLLIALSAVTAVVMIVWGGIEYMWSASFSERKAGLQRAKNAIYGLLLVLTSYIILRTIDPRFVEIPNTLVPQLKVEEWLKRDVNLELRNQLEEQVNAYTLEGIEVAENLKKTQIKMAEIQQKIIQKTEEIDALGPVAPTDPKFKALQIEREKLNEGLNNENANRILGYSEGLLKAIARDALEDITNDNNFADTYRDNVLMDDNNERLIQTIKLLNGEKVRIDNLITNTEKQLFSINSLETNKTFVSMANYEKAIIDLNKIKIRATDTYVGEKETPRGAKIKNLYIADESGSINAFPYDKTYIEKAKQQYQKEIESVKIIQSGLNEQEKTKLESVIKETSDILDNKFKEISL